jgi:hypothetical protein
MTFRYTYAALGAHGVAHRRSPKVNISPFFSLYGIEAIMQKSCRDTIDDFAGSGA